MIIVIVCKEKCKRSGRILEICSHNIDVDTGKIIILPNDSPERIGAKWDFEIGEFVLE